MKIAIIGVLGIFLAATQGFAAEDGAEKTISKSFTVKPGGELSVDTDRGDIQVVTADQNSVDIVVERQVVGGSEGQAAGVLKKHKVTFTQDGNKVHVEAELPKSSGFSFRRKPQLNVHFRITVPRRFSAMLNTSGGTIRASDLRGMVDARSSGGDLFITKIEGQVEGHTSGGNIDVIGCTDKLLVQTSGGNIVLKDYTGPSATVDTSGGNIEVHSCAGKLQAKTSGGNIAIDGFSGASSFVDTSGGTISLGVEKQPTGDCWYHSSGGNITVRLPGEIAMNLNASTDGGSVTTAIPVNTTVQGRAKEGHLEGKMNAGGPLLSLRTSGGDIQILKR